MIELSNTDLLYFDDSYLFESTATVLEIKEIQNLGTAVILNQTIFYPQGGGQPYDTGAIAGKNGNFLVEAVRFSEGVVFHFGGFTQGSFEPGCEVELKIDEERRLLNCVNHTAGHLVDVAMINAGFGFWPTKGYHFPDSPYVEYEGMIDHEEREASIRKLEKELSRLISEGKEVESMVFNNYDDLKKHCNFVPEYIPKDKPVRVVKVAGVGCPCGGTHVKDISEIGNIKITKIKAKGGKIRVSYKIA